MNIKKIFFSGMVACAFMLLFSISVCAATSDELTYYDAMLKSTYGSNYNSPSSVPSTEENIDYTSGSYVEDVVDLSIPGKNGFDLNFLRKFNSQGSSRVLRYVEYPYRHEVAKYIGYYYNVEIDGYTHNVLVAFQNEEAAYDAKDSFRGRNYTLNNRGYALYVNIHAPTGALTYVRDTTKARKIINSEDIFGHRATGTGTFSDALKIDEGWYIPMPTMNVTYKYSYGNDVTAHGEFIDAYGKIYRYELDYENGNEIDICNYFIIKNCAGRYTVAYANPYNIEEYTTHDKGFLYNAYVKASDGTTYYFETTDNNFFDIKGMSDKFGNTIIYEKTQNGYILTDTYGVRYECNPTGIYRLDDESRKQLVKYETGAENSNDDVRNEFKIDNNYILRVSKLYKQNEDIENTDNVVTYNMAYRLSAPNITNSGAFVYGFYPEKIEYPTGAVKHISYDRYEKDTYDRNTTEYINYVSESKDEYQSDIKNHFTYEISLTHTSDYTNVRIGTYIKNRVSDGQKTEYTISETQGLTKKQVIGADTDTYTYNSSSVLLYSKGIRGITTSYTYDSKGNMTSETTGKTRINYTYDTEYYRLQLTKLYDIDEDTSARVEYVLSDDHKFIIAEKTYDGNSLMSTVNYTYDENNNLASTIMNKSDGEQVKKTYETIYLPEGGMQVTETVHNIKDADGNALANIATVTKTDMFGNVIYTRDGNGNEQFMEYDLAGRLLKKINPDGTVQTVDYNIVNNTIIETAINGNKIKYEYDPFGLLTEVYLNTDGTWDILESYAYDSMSRQISFKQYITDTDYYLLENTYDTSDRLVTEEIKDINGNTLNGADYTYSYKKDADGYIARVYNRQIHSNKSGISQYSYPTESVTLNYQGKVIENKLTPHNSTNSKTSTNTYDYVGNLLSSTDPKGNTENYYYDYQNNMIRTTNAMGVSAYSIYDEVGCVIGSSNYEEENVDLMYTNYTYDNAGRLIKQSSPYNVGLYSDTKHYYDANGNVIMTKQQATNTEYDTVTYTYDSLNRVTTAYDGLSYTQYFYDLYGNIEYMAYGHTAPLASIADADIDTAVTHYEYDKQNRLVKLTDPMGFTESYTYDKLGNMLTKTDKNGVVNTYTYDYAGNILSVKAGDSYVNYEYNRYGKPTKITNIAGVITYSYDVWGNVRETAHSPSDNNAKWYTAEYSYDANGNRTEMFFKRGIDNNSYDIVCTNYTYDELNRMTSVICDNDTTTYTYDNNSNLITKTSNGQTVYMAYDISNKLVYLSRPYETASDPTWGDAYYMSYKPNGKLASIHDPIAGSQVVYTYDRQGRLTESASTDGSNSSYGYDTRGNLNNMSIMDKYGNMTYSNMSSDLNNRLTYKTTTYGNDVWNNTDYTYDNNGNRLSELMTSQIYSSGEDNEENTDEEIDYDNFDLYNNFNSMYEYDEFNRLTRYVSMGVDDEYTYYGNNLRLGIYDINGNLTKQHMYDGQNVVGDVTTDGTYTYKRGIDLISRSKNGGEEEYYYFDPHGSVRALVSKSGEILHKYDYTDFGEHIDNTYDDNPFKYCAEYQDYSPMGSMIYLRNRYYQPVTGRFLTQDPAQDGMNWYMYCGGDPINFVDPSGENFIYNAWNAGEDAVWKAAALGLNAYGWKLSADLLWLASSGSGNEYIAVEGSYASNLAKNDSGINKFVNDVIWAYGTSQNESNPNIPTQTYEIPLSNGDLGAALHNVNIDISASRNSDGVWTATVTLTDTFDFTEFKDPFKQGSFLSGLLWAANDIAYYDTKWGLLDPVEVQITYTATY